MTTPRTPQSRYLPTPLSKRLRWSRILGLGLGTALVLWGGAQVHKNLRPYAPVPPRPNPTATAAPAPSDFETLIQKQTSHNTRFINGRMWKIYEQHGQYGFTKSEREALAAVVHRTGIPLPSLLSTLEVHQLAGQITAGYINDVLQKGTVPGSRQNENARIASILAHVRKQAGTHRALASAVDKVQGAQHWNSYGPAQQVWTKIQARELDKTVRNADAHLHSAQQNWTQLGQMHLEKASHFQYKEGRWWYVETQTEKTRPKTMPTKKQKLSHQEMALNTARPNARAGKTAWRARTMRRA